MPEFTGNDINNHVFENSENEEKIICDPVHGQIGFSSLCMKIIDTPEFQRLRSIKQLGFAYAVYPGATNNRFEHSLGVAYLSKEFLVELRNHQPELNITDEDISCVQIAGLCHDLGHGPFSHFWERFMKESKSLRNDDGSSWDHEKASVRIFDYLIEKYQLAEEFEKFRIDDTGIAFIRDLITGKSTNDGRMFFYQIVNNEESGLDVDKWDYYLRDCHYLGIKCGFEYKRLMQFARVIDVEGRKIICFRDKVISTVYGMFRTRSQLHHSAYQHRTVRRIERIISDALIEADGKVIAPNGEIFQFYNWTNDLLENNRNIEETMKNYCMMTDESVYNALKYSKVEKISNAVDVVEKRFRNSKLYRTISSWSVKDNIDQDQLKEEIIRFISEISCNDKRKFCEKFNSKFKYVDKEDFMIQIISIDWGKDEENPVNSVYFYSKDNMDKAFKWKEGEAEWMAPKRFKDMRLNILCKQHDNTTFEVLKMGCEMYKKNNI